MGSINSPVPIQRTVRSEVDMSFVLGIRAFSLETILAKNKSALSVDKVHLHDKSVTSIGMEFSGEVEERALIEWIQWLLKERGPDIYRCKGIMAVKGKPKRYVFHGIHMIFEG